MDEQIRIFVHTNTEVIELIVIQSDPVDCIRKMVKMPLHYLILFNDSVIMRHFSFVFYGIRADDHFYVVDLDIKKLQAFYTKEPTSKRIYDPDRKSVV